MSNAITGLALVLMLFAICLYLGRIARALENL
jgi:hypothetical protein